MIAALELRPWLVAVLAQHDIIPSRMTRASGWPKVFAAPDIALATHAAIESANGDIVHTA